MNGVAAARRTEIDGANEAHAQAGTTSTGGRMPAPEGARYGASQTLNPPQSDGRSSATQAHLSAFLELNSKISQMGGVLSTPLEPSGTSTRLNRPERGTARTGSAGCSGAHYPDRLRRPSELRMRSSQREGLRHLGHDIRPLDKPVSGALRCTIDLEKSGGLHRTRRCRRIGSEASQASDYGCSHARTRTVSLHAERARR